MFETVKPGPVDPMFILKKKADADHSADKIDLGAGIYRNETGKYHELACIKEAKKILDLKNLGHDYGLTTGDPKFLQIAAKILFGNLSSDKIASVQTISGTGANHLAALFLSRDFGSQIPKVYLGTPAWGNYEPLFKLVGFEVETYNYYDAAQGIVDFDSHLGAIRGAPEGSLFILQGCCHNPTGADFTKEQWQILAQEIKAKKHFPFFDIAYQGLGDSMDDDSYGVRFFAEAGFEMVVCQSFSKNFALYGERCGVLHVVTNDGTSAANVKDQLRSLIRWEFSSSPAYGSRLVSIVAEDDTLTKNWQEELTSIRTRLKAVREQLYNALTQELKTPGDWSVILKTKGLFCLLPLSEEQCNRLVDEHRIYFLSNGRINIAGLNKSNIQRAAAAIDSVVNSS